ncbi:uncharacterized protein CLUP02_09956 [Colletotrichum lupini]|uniref:Uncharacterized protein n=1 Tax=Colletotrichum lupini TaxID=145971 RepID=A0A9Q8SWM4_9PEZI|nr:uncharacterized protein CLUP02_09956 [Colletotrichum lupini]UQC84460.1 hypothetical protein CLUP02_09956 [Colletotrichum lupini]
MKFSSVIISIISLTVGTAIANPARLENRQKAPGVGDPNAQCDDKHDCCFSSEAACFRQYGTLPGNIYCPLHKTPIAVQSPMAWAVGARANRRSRYTVFTGVGSRITLLFRMADAFRVPLS